MILHVLRARGAPWVEKHVRVFGAKSHGDLRFSKDNKSKKSIYNMACSTSRNTGTPEHPGTPPKPGTSTRKPETPPRKPGTPPKTTQNSPNSLKKSQNTSKNQGTQGKEKPECETRDFQLLEITMQYKCPPSVPFFNNRTL